MAEPGAEAELNSKLKEAISLIEAGRRTEARTLLRSLSQETPNVAAVWLWLAAVTEDVAERTGYLRRVLEIEPANQKARAALSKLGVALPPLASPAKPSSAELIKNLESFLTAALALVAIILIIFIFSSVVVNRLNQPTATPTSTQTPTPTQTLTPSPGPSPTLTPSLTPFVRPSLPPSWTPAPSSTPLPTRTPPDTATPYPTETTTPTLEPSVTLTPRPTHPLLESPTPGTP